jgi:2'-hydroxyisoflavone reductase
MQLLILGGTQFVGRHIVEAFLAASHTVSILTRGVTVDELPATVERLRGDRDAGSAGLHTLEGRSWDACVDVSGYMPRQVRPSAEHLRSQAKRYLFISAVRVYGDPDRRPVRETHPLVPPAAEDVTEINNDTYGPLKVACEHIVQDIYGHRGTLLRPQVVVGPHDPSGRYTYWVNRAVEGGEMLAPGDGSDHIQVIDARDLARFVVMVVENDLGGVFNLVGPRITWAEFMHVLGANHVVWVNTEILRTAGLSEGGLPLFRPEHGAWSSLMDVNNERARAAGLTLTEPAITIKDTRAWSLGRDLPCALTAEREAELILNSRQRGQH